MTHVNKMYEINPIKRSRGLSREMIRFAFSLKPILEIRTNIGLVNFLDFSKKGPEKPTKGVIRGDYTAEVEINIDFYAEILSALLLEIPVTAIAIEPKILNPGVNKIKIRFSSIPGIKPNRTYNIMFYLNNYKQITATVVFQP